MIRTFAHKGLENFYKQGSQAGIQPAHAKRLRLILGLLHAATTPQDMGFPGSGLHPLRGQWEGHWAVSVNGPWRVIFHFENGHAWKVNYVQYH